MCLWVYLSICPVCSMRRFVIVDVQKMHYAYRVRLWWLWKGLCHCDRFYKYKKKKSDILITVVVAFQKYLKRARLCQSGYLPSQRGVMEIAGYCLSLCWAKMIWSHWSIVSVTHDVFPMALAVSFTPSVPGCCKFLQSLSLSVWNTLTRTNTTWLFIWSWVWVPWRTVNI